MAKERVQKLLAAAGIGSRRACEALIEAGRVKVNGQVVHRGDKADPEKDTIVLDGKVIRLPKQKIYIALNKPKGYLSDIDETHPKPTVFDLVDIPEPLFSVGRLDLDSEGLILLTNDGELANRLTHPRYRHEKEYEVFVIKQPDEERRSAHHQRPHEHRVGDGDKHGKSDGGSHAVVFPCPVIIPQNRLCAVGQSLQREHHHRAHGIDDGHDADVEIADRRGGAGRLRAEILAPHPPGRKAAQPFGQQAQWAKPPAVCRVPGLAADEQGCGQGQQTQQQPTGQSRLDRRTGKAQQQGYAKGQAKHA